MNDMTARGRSIHRSLPRWVWVAAMALLVGALYLALGGKGSWALPNQDAPRATVQTEVHGHVNLQGRPVCPNWRWRIRLHVVLYSTANPSIPYREVDIWTDNCGDFVIPNVGVGLNNITVKGLHTLRVRRNNVYANPTVPGPVTHVNFGTLREGDANNDNTVNAVDSAIMASAYWTGVGDPGYDARADFNGDNYIDARDAALLASNYWRNGSN